LEQLVLTKLWRLDNAMSRHARCIGLDAAKADAPPMSISRSATRRIIRMASLARPAAALAPRRGLSGLGGDVERVGGAQYVEPRGVDLHRSFADLFEHHVGIGPRPLGA
jgi:hypothetical protein